VKLDTRPKLKILLLCLAGLWVLPLIVVGVLNLGLRFDGGQGPRCRGGETRPFRAADVQRVLRSRGIASSLDSHNEGCAVPGVQTAVASKGTVVPLVQCNVSTRAAYSRTKVTEYNTRPRRTFELANVECDLVPLGSATEIAAQLERVRTAVASLNTTTG
jgi:hypothetical protein